MDNSISMNNLNQVAFTTRTSTAASTRRIVVADGTTTTLFPTVSDGAGFTSIDFFAPSINDTGLVAFRGNDNQPTPRDSVFVTDGVTFQRIAGVNDTLMTDAGPRVVAFLMGGVSHQQRWRRGVWGPIHRWRERHLRCLPGRNAHTNSDTGLQRHLDSYQHHQRARWPVALTRQSGPAAK